MLLSSIEFFTQEEVVEHLGSDSTFGLSKREAKLRIKEHKANTLKSFPLIGILVRFLSPFSYLLGILTLVTFLLLKQSELPYIFLVATVTHTFLYYLLHIPSIVHHIERYIGLKKRLPKYAKVSRDKKTENIRTKDIVPGDIVFLEEGDLVPADIRVLSSSFISVDESILFGEKFVFQRKNARPVRKSTVEPSVTNTIYAGSRIQRGTAKGIVIATGKNRSFNDILRLSDMPRVSLLERQLLKMHALFALAYILFIVGILLLQSDTVLIIDISVVFLILTPTLFPLLLIPEYFSKEHSHSFDNKKSILLPLKKCAVDDDIAGSKVWLEGKLYEVSNVAKVKKRQTQLQSIFELLYLSIPELDDIPHLGSLHTLKTWIQKKCKISLSNNDELTLHAPTSYFYFDQQHQGYYGKSTFHNKTQGDAPVLLLGEDKVVTHYGHPNKLLDESLYVWTEQTSIQKRRFFKAEKEKLKAKFAALEEDGYALHALALETQEKKEKKITTVVTFLGCVLIPKKFHNQTLSFLQKAKKSHKRVFFYTEQHINHNYLSKTLGLPRTYITSGPTLFGKSQKYLCSILQHPVHVFENISSKNLKCLADTANSAGLAPLTVLDTKSPVARTFGLNAESFYLQQKKQKCSDFFKKFLHTEHIVKSTKHALLHLVHFHIIIAVTSWYFIQNLSLTTLIPFIITIQSLPLFLMIPVLIMHFTKVENINHTHIGTENSVRFFTGLYSFLIFLIKVLIVGIVSVLMLLFVGILLKMTIVDMLLGMKEHTFFLSLFVVLLSIIALTGTLFQSTFHLFTRFVIGLVLASVIIYIFTIFYPIQNYEMYLLHPYFMGLLATIFIVFSVLMIRPFQKP